MLYYYWVTKGIRPSVFVSMPYGEALVVRAFYEKEVKDIQTKNG
jgi:hypothetical protein